jgi:predicted nucleotidyltransferase
MPLREVTALHLEPQYLQLLQKILHAHVPEAQVWAYGSRVKGGGHEGSDLDVVLRHTPDPTQDVAGWLALKEALQNSALPMLVEVHLWSRLPAAFYDNIHADYVELQTGGRSSPAAHKP